MCVVLVPNIGLRTTRSHITQIHPQIFRNFMCVHWECAWCQCQILVLEPPDPTLHKYTHRYSETSCVSTGNVRGAIAKYWYQHQHTKHYTNTPTAVQKLHVCPLRICVVLVPSIGLRTTISNTTQIRPQYFRNVMRVHWECAWCCAKYWSQNHHIQHYTNLPTALQKLNVLPLGMCVVLMPNIGVNTSIFNTTQIRPQHFRNFMCGNVHGASIKYLRTTISNNTKIRSQYFRNFMRVYWEYALCQYQILVLAPVYPTLYTNTPTALQCTCTDTCTHTHSYTHTCTHTHSYTHIYTNTHLIYAHTHTHNSLERSVRYTKFTCISYTIRVPPFSFSKVHKCTT